VDDQTAKPVDATPIAELKIDPSTPLFRVRSFSLLFITRVASTTATQMLSVVVGWHVYELTDSALHLGLIGLVQFLPPVLLLLISGQVADRYNRRMILRCCYAVAFSSSAGLMLIATMPNPSLTAIYTLVLINSSARIFEQPVMQALVPVMVPRVIFSRAIAAHISARQLSVLIGPSLGGLLYFFGPAFDYSICATLFLAAAGASFLLPNPPVPTHPPEMSLDTVLAGFRFIGRCKPVLGALVLDFVATLAGGVSALLPIYARDILEVGSWGAGVLRSAPALGALVAGAVMTRFPVKRSGGTWILASFAVYGIAIIVFGASTNFVLSALALVVTGAADMVSSLVRQIIIQMTTPDEMRGRVSAVNAMFYGTAGQLGGFRAGVMAHALGAVSSVVVGGVAVLAIVAMWTWLFPSLGRVDRPDDVRPEAVT
jgi:MFS family permease